MAKVFIYANSCKLRRLDANRLVNYFKSNNHEIVNSPKSADFIIFVTCGFKNEVAEMCISRIKDFKRYNAKLIVAGCLPLIEKENLSKVFNGITIGTTELEKIDEYFPDNKIKFNDIEYSNLLFKNPDKIAMIDLFKRYLFKISFFEKVYSTIKMHILSNVLVAEFNLYIGSDQSYMVRISQGCNENCSYCAIKKAIGNLKSKPIDQCIKEYKKGIEEGHKLISFVADDLGAYGLDIGLNFGDLLKKISDEKGSHSIKLLDLNPKWVVRYKDSLIDLIKKRKIEALVIPIQSGNPRILELMQRYADVNEIKKIFSEFKKTDPGINLVTAVIAGFPTETIEEFFDSIEFIKQTNIDYGVIIGFSCKTKTKAETINPKISEENIIKRIKKGSSYLEDSNYRIRKISKNILSFEKTKNRNKKRFF